MRVLGVDPGLTRCGVGVVEGVPGRPCTLLNYYVIYSDPDEDLADRLLNLDQHLTDLIAVHKPESVAVERVFSQHNVRTVMGTAQAGAVAILAAAKAGLPVQTYTPSEVKAAVTGSGQADKAQVTAMVTRLLRLDAPPRPADAADALALAICHVWRGGTRAKIAAAASRACAPFLEGRVMIASVSGAVAEIGADFAVVEVGGVGYAVRCTPGTLAGLQIGAPVRLSTSLIVREDSFTLYGFADSDEKQLFELLLTANGVGPRLALAVLAVHHPDVVRKAIANSEIAVLTAVPGIGKKGAERICLELHDKVGPIPVPAPGRPGRRRTGPPGRTRSARRWSASAGAAAQAEVAITELGEEVERAVADGHGVPSVQVLLRAAIRHLGGAAAARADGGSDERPRLGLRRRCRARRRGQRPAQAAQRVHRPAPGPRAARPAAEERAAARQPARSHPAQRIARAGQDHARHDRRRRAGRRPADHQRPGDRALRRPGRDPDQPGQRRRAVHRRDPPDRQAGRGAALQRDGGLPGRRDRRQGPGRHRDPARRRAVHPGRRHHPGRPADRPDAGPLRLRRPPRLLRAGRAGRADHPVGRDPRRRR